MTVSSPTTLLRARVQLALNAEFAPESIVFVSDKLDDSLGWDGAYGAVYPEEDVIDDFREIVLIPKVVAQLYGRWDKEINPKQAVDPGQIEEFAERLRRALQPSYVGSAHDWYITVRRVEYPDDPTGNKTRLRAYIEGHAQNPQVQETHG